MHWKHPIGTAFCALAAAPLAAQSANPAAMTAPSTFDTASPVRQQAPKGAPNIIVIMLDDVGFGATSAFGGPIPTPALDKLAGEGLRFNRFHTTAICSPTRASLLTGRNPHAVHMGAVMNSADSRPGYSGFQTKDAISIAEILRRAGYNTAAFGKWHQTPDSEVTPNGPFDRWPTGQGFEKFYGFQGGEADQFAPTVYDGTRSVDAPTGAGYHFTQDIADKAISWLKTQNALEPNRPAFLYFAPGATHAPLQAPQEWIDRFKGRFDAGWDAMREESFARQKRLGIIPANTKLTPRLPQLPAWSSLAPDQKRVAARLMEVYAGFLAHSDAQVGRLLDELRASGEYDNTLVFYLVGDNGASPEGGISGSNNYIGAYQLGLETDAQRLAQIETMGGTDTNSHYPSAWAWAMNTPFRWAKTVASHLGATRNGMVMSWPQRVGTEAGHLRSQFSHVNDVAPTILDAVGIAAPAQIDGIAQKSMDGTSLLYTIPDDKAAERHTTQYFEVFGNRAIYHHGWMASAFHGRQPWTPTNMSQNKFEDDVWELYNLTKDFSQSRDLAARHPAKLAELKALFDTEAARNLVLPLANVMPQKGLPSLAQGRASMTFEQGVRSIPESALPRTAGQSWSMTADLTLAQGAQGVVAAVGGGAGGWSVYLRPDGIPALTYRLFNLATAQLAGTAPLSPGQHRLRFDFDNYGGYGKPATIHLFVDDQPAGSQDLPASPIGAFALDDGFSVGVDTGSPVGDYPAGTSHGFPFTDGQVNRVTITRH
jgi:arylsulfatase